jgi:hypothetical protein
VTGAVFTGLGGLTVMASGITWLVAWGKSGGLDDDCPEGYCIEGTRGGDRYQAVEDLAATSELLLGLGASATLSGIALLVLGGTLRGKPERSRFDASIGPTGGSFEVRF